MQNGRTRSVRRKIVWGATGKSLDADRRLVNRLGHYCIQRLFSVGFAEGLWAASHFNKELYNAVQAQV